MSFLQEKLSPDNLKLTQPIPITLHPAGVYLSGLGHGSRRTIRYSLNTIARLLTSGECDAMSLDWSKLRYHHTAAVRVALMDNFAPITVNKMLSTLRRVLQEAYRLDLMKAEDYNKAVDFPNVLASPGEPKGRLLRADEITALMKTCDGNSVMDRRDAAIIAILRGTGMRRAELVNLSLRDFDPAALSLTIRLGKRNKGRKVYLPKEAIALIENWLAIRGDEPGPLLCRIRRGGHLHLGKMHSDAIWRIIQKRGRASWVGVLLTS